MEWMEVTIETSLAGVELVCASLYSIGIRELEIVDEAEIIDLINSGLGNWDYVDSDFVNTIPNPPLVKVYLSCNAYGYELFTALKSSVSLLKKEQFGFDLGSLQIVVSTVKEEDWANNWKLYFKPLRIGKRLIIKPSWEEFSAVDNEIILELDPGAAFGTGTHESTRLCLELIEHYIKKGDSLLDVGCGSGILSIAALLLGATDAFAVDLDPNATDVALRNAQLNGFSDDCFFVYTGNILEDVDLKEKIPRKRFDIVVANIIADVIILLARDVRNYLTNDGIFICSGIIDSRVDDVCVALTENGFDICHKKIMGSWVVIVAIYNV